MSVKEAIPTEIHDDTGDFKRIEFYDTEGDHIIDAVWDDRDEQTPKNRTEFRIWAYRLMRDKGYQVIICTTRYPSK